MKLHHFIITRISLFSIIWAVSIEGIVHAATPSLMGQSEAEIRAKYGEPKTVMDMGDTKILGFKEILVEFEGGGKL
jgi:hypothetical protein